MKREIVKKILEHTLTKSFEAGDRDASKLDDQLEQADKLFGLYEWKKVGGERRRVLKTVGPYHFVLDWSEHPEAFFTVNLHHDAEQLASIGFLFLEVKPGEKSVVITNIQGKPKKQEELKRFAEFVNKKHASHALIEALKEVFSKTDVRSIYGLPAAYLREIYPYSKLRTDLNLIYDESFKATNFKKTADGLYHYKVS